jgi:trimeric autotransporter adhesin
MAERSAAQLELLEHELEQEVLEGIEEATHAHAQHLEAVDALRTKAEAELATQHRHHRKQQQKLKDALRRTLRSKTEALQQLESLQDQLALSRAEARLARQRQLDLEAALNDLQTQPPPVRERADPASAMELARLRDRLSASEAALREAQKEARTARESVGRENAANAALQRDLEAARYRLVSLQGSLSETAQESAALSRELEAERVRSVAAKLQAEESEAARATAARQAGAELERIKGQRDAFCEAASTSTARLRRLSRHEAARRLVAVSAQHRRAAACRALHRWALAAAREQHSSTLRTLRARSAADTEAAAAAVEAADKRCAALRRRATDAEAAAAASEAALSEARRTGHEQYSEVESLRPLQQRLAERTRALDAAESESSAARRALAQERDANEALRSELRALRTTSEAAAAAAAELQAERDALAARAAAAAARAARAEAAALAAKGTALAHAVGRVEHAGLRRGLGRLADEVKARKMSAADKTAAAAAAAATATAAAAAERARAEQMVSYQHSGVLAKLHHCTRYFHIRTDLHKRAWTSTYFCNASSASV